MNEKHPLEEIKEKEIESNLTAKSKYDLCKQCDYLNEFKFCKQCGCFMPLKVFVPGATCPINKW